MGAVTAKGLSRARPSDMSYCRDMRWVLALAFVSVMAAGCDKGKSAESTKSTDEVASKDDKGSDKESKKDKKDKNDKNDKND